jgi:predicted RNase H-like nuclease
VRSVLGIDAAWTTTQPSGVALVVEEAGRWRLGRVASSYAEFLSPASRGVVNVSHHLDPAALLSAATAAGGGQVTLVAADIPLAATPITGRRISDNQVSIAYGSRHASTHTPSITRPGPISDRYCLEFGKLGYPLVTHGEVTHGLIEVYPHPALIELSGAARRLPYKESKIAKYWPDLSVPERRQRLLEQWDVILQLLARHIEGVMEAFKPIPLSSPRRAMKAFEDALDAVVCAWVGICVLEGRATAFGDPDSAIWIPDLLDPRPYGTMFTLQGAPLPRRDRPGRVPQAPSGR